MKQSNLPSYLSCAFCPAQALLTRGGHLIRPNDQFPHGLLLKRYVCPSKHTFLVEEDEGVTIEQMERS